MGNFLTPYDDILPIFGDVPTLVHVDLLHCRHLGPGTAVQARGRLRRAAGQLRALRNAALGRIQRARRSTRRAMRTGQCRSPTTAATTIRGCATPTSSASVPSTARGRSTSASPTSKTTTCASPHPGQRAVRCRRLRFRHPGQRPGVASGGRLRAPALRHLHRQPDAQLLGCLGDRSGRRRLLLRLLGPRRRRRRQRGQRHRGGRTVQGTRFRRRAMGTLLQLFAVPAHARSTPATCAWPIAATPATASTSTPTARAPGATLNGIVFGMAHFF